ncbi:histone-like nucleoid-structuring protein Lsr2 [Salinispora arenicola]|uniref:Lsr2 family DNA-binding protein n=1 Tax=Salinispora arenicola TaxID=168697 RepID=UPI0003718C12|nr:histone-like nucleoid-structuring protein Lsr2 [Salinispora arenicola]
MSTVTRTPANGTDRAALLRAAKGTPAAPTQRVPMGIRVTAAPGTQATAVDPTQHEVGRSVDELLHVGASSEAARTRHLAAKIRGLVQELTSRVEAEETQRREREATEARRRELAATAASLASQLAEVRQELRAGRDSAASSRNRREGAGERAAIRKWAQANGYGVADRGRISREVREAYATDTGLGVAR